jgi:CRP-like cAMP-binding protein
MMSVPNSICDRTCNGALFPGAVNRKLLRKPSLMLKQFSSSTNNRFLSSLPINDYQRLLPELEHVELPNGLILHMSGEKHEYVYLPEDGVISIVSIFEDGGIVEAGIAGRDGLTGIASFLFDGVSPRQQVVQVPGYGHRIKVDAFGKAFAECPQLRTLALRYVYAFHIQVSQNGACNLRHPMSSRLAKWLSMVQDRVGSPEFYITQEFIAQMLGVQRPTVSAAANQLRDDGLIEYSRGHIRILSRDGLLNEACECYALVREVYDRYLKP